MPLYEYECTACHKRTEKIQKFSDPEITVCPKCGGPLERVLSAPAISFKGGGWYADGYGNAKPQAGASEGKSEGGKSEGGKSEGGSSDSKPASDGSSTGTPSPAPAASTPAAAASPAASSTPAAKS